MATRVKHGIKVISVDVGQAAGVGQCLLCGQVLAEAIGLGGLSIRLIAFRVERRLATGWRNQGDVGAGVLEGVVGRGEFFQPEAGFLAGVAELIVGSQNHQDFHRAP
ncbi:hypothetical protein D3C81_1841260 [compost metagenome]